ncbi:nucleoside 2-deoxyribosyltransferase [Entomohabitans teleogrylli]|uniref:nucleoside 2-deoxyribosyltransferase n=1 Tax=Entomohabitans teleogrylli TaxID=1384589 RepID=UPI00073D99DB|nr:nucleoside 2-deoxyribosyltransferase [Entomohabitans teleogrylli]
MVNIYLASPFFSDDQIDRVQRVEQALEKNKTVDKYFSPRLADPDNLEYGSMPWRDFIFKNDIKHLDEATVVVAVVDFFEDHVDSGTAYEIGYAHAFKKPLIIVQEKGHTLNLMISESLTRYVNSVEELASYDFTRLEKNVFTGDVF